MCACVGRKKVDLLKINESCVSMRWMAFLVNCQKVCLYLCGWARRLGDIHLVTIKDRVDVSSCLTQLSCKPLDLRDRKSDQRGGEWEPIKNSRKQKFGQDPDLKPKSSLQKDAWCSYERAKHQSKSLGTNKNRSEKERQRDSGKQLGIWTPVEPTSIELNSSVKPTSQSRQQ